MDFDNLVSRAKWQAEEDEGEDVKDNWEDEDEEPPKPPPQTEQPKKTTQAAKKKASNKIGDDSGNNDRPLTAQELREKRLREEKLQKESDMKLTKQMLGMEDKDIELEFPLESKEDFDKFHKNLVHKLWCYDKSPHYYPLLDKLFRDLCVPLESDELKNLSAAVNALFNEKVKQSKSNKPKKKASKIAIKVERTNMDREDYMDELDDIM